MEEYVKSHGGCRVIKKILIANNGMAATKAILSMRQWAFLELGSEKELEFVVMASLNDLQANAEFIRLADAFVEVPAGKNSNNYANVELICEVAQSQQVQAVWPGWGHASENPELPRALERLGITFLGPTAPVMHALGDKIASTILAQSSGVPCIPWNGDGVTAEIQADGSIPQEPFKRACLQSVEEAIACANRIGYPVVLKASEGGGGKGIRKCQNEKELRMAWDLVRAEVVGSPVFMMQLCVGARHLEVQLVGDEHGSVIALIGRDCSTQRRFQKIFEEGPPTIAPRDAFREAEKAAQRLAMSVGYRGAGTVEYLFKKDSGVFSFLELNPRLQVEHPVTEGLTGVNLPALQLQIGLGIKLSRVPDIRRFYSLEPEGDSAIDFLEDPYVYPKIHVIAARVTAENPDDSFRPTSGKLERVRFQSSPNAWGYFSIGANGTVHEFADSQFGHIFAKGPTREDARRALQLALRNTLATGEVRTPVEYLVELLDTGAFKENTIDTAWLDQLIAANTLKAQFHQHDAILLAACFRAYSHLKEARSKLVDGLSRGHVPLRNDLRLLQSFVVEVAYDSIKYVWQVRRTQEDTYALTIAGSTFETSIREQPDGSLYVKTGERVVQIAGIEEPLGLRLRIEGGSTIMFPVIRDPSELRSDFNGKLVRYLHQDGAEVAEGEPFAELEAMKMIMSLSSTATGKIHHELGPGAIVGAGQLLANIDLADPSKFKTVKPFSGTFQPSAANTSVECAGSLVLDLSLDEVQQALSACLDGFNLRPSAGNSGTQVVQRLFQADDHMAEQKAATLKITSQLLGKFLHNEKFFAGLTGGNETQIVTNFQGEAADLLNLLVAHDNLQGSVAIISAILNSLATLGGFDDTLAGLPEDLMRSLEEGANLPDEGGYGGVKFLAKGLLDQTKVAPPNERVGNLRTMLRRLDRKEELIAIANSQVEQGDSYFGLDLIAASFKDEDVSIRARAVELYIRRLYRGFEIVDFDLVQAQEVVKGTPAAELHATWNYQLPGVSGRLKQGYAVILPHSDSLPELQKAWVMPLVPALHVIHILVADAPLPESRDPKMHEECVAKNASDAAALITGVAGKLDEKKHLFSVKFSLVRGGNKSPTFMDFRKDASDVWREVPEYRGLRSVHPFVLELPALGKDYKLSPVMITRCISILLGTPQQKKDTETLFVRGAFYNPMGLDNLEAEISRVLLRYFDYIERTLLDPVLEQKQLSSRVFMHFMSPIPQCTERDLNYLGALFNHALQDCITTHNARLLKLNVDAIEAKIWVSASPAAIPLRLVASRTSGWATMAFRETVAEATGRPESWTDLETNERHEDYSKTTPLEEKFQSKRKVANNAGSTYIYDFPVLFRVSLTKQWLRSPEMYEDDDTRGRSVSVSASAVSGKVQQNVFSAVELVLDEASGELKEQQRIAGQNNIGMVVWLCNMRTPEYPRGREMILIGNDLTIKAGSFGTAEDTVYQKASELARTRGIPRVYIACNSGARLGGVEELKALVQVAWVDPADLNKGFDYLYLPEDALAKLPPDSVRSHPVVVDGKTRHVLDAILGLNLPSTKGGIGVENLQGSGLIAGETSRAYDETFTLSYVTGRSVGIGAYLNRLGQRNIQMVHGPMILTGYQALNKLLGKQVYTTQDQLGGPHIMVPNGVTHELVANDQDGVEAILRWLAYVPADVTKLPPVVPSQDPVDREIQFMPTKSPYDPRHMLAGTTVDGEWQSGFCDQGSFHEYMSGWAKTVIVGRGRLGGIPIGIIAVETRAVERQIPADPANLTSNVVKEAQAGQVWYPDSAFKTATAIRDFNKGENLPLVIFANWRGFSGGTRDMFAEVLKFGAMIVDALVAYRRPVTIYIPPGGELRGGAWVVLDPKINPAHMEMFADKESRGGILEPPAASEIIFKQDGHVLTMMHRCDETLQGLDAEKAAGKDVAEAIKAREKTLIALYRQVAVHYCDLHDRSARMKGLGAIHEELEWRRARSYLHWRIRRRLRETSVIDTLVEQVPNCSRDEAKAVLQDMLPAPPSGGDGEDRAVAEWLEANASEVADRVAAEREEATEKHIFDLVKTLPRERMVEMVRDLQGFVRASERAQGKSKFSPPAR